MIMGYRKLRVNKYYKTHLKQIVEWFFKREIMQVIVSF